MSSPVSSATPAVAVASPFWRSESVQASAGSAAIAVSSASVMVHPTVNPDRAERGVHRVEVFEEVVGGAGTVDANQDFPAVAGGDLVDRVGEDPDVVTDRVGSGVAFSQQHGQDSVVFAHHAPRGWKPNPFLNVTAAPCLSECAVIRVDVQVDDDPPVQEFTGDQQPGESVRPVGDQVPDPSAGFRPSFGDLTQGDRVEGGQAAADGAVRGRVTEHRGLMGQQVDVGHAGRAERDRHRQRREYGAPVPTAGALTAGYH